VMGGKLTFWAKLWRWLCKYLLPILAALIPVAGWVLEWRSHQRTKRERDVARENAVRSREVAAVEAKARLAAVAAARKHAERVRELEVERRAVDEAERTVLERVDEHAGNVDEVAEDLNELYGLGEDWRERARKGIAVAEELYDQTPVPGGSRDYLLRLIRSLNIPAPVVSGVPVTWSQVAGDLGRFSTEDLRCLVRDWWFLQRWNAVGGLMDDGGE